MVYIILLLWGNMNKTLILAVVITSSFVIVGISNANAFEIPQLGGILRQSPIGFDVTMKVLATEIVPSGKNGDGSYYLIYGIDQKAGKDRIIEIQNNAAATITNLNDAKSLNRDYNYMKIKANIGNIVKLNCNGADNLDAFEEYPQCYKIAEIKKP